jgi:hypothetical protein
VGVAIVAVLIWSCASDAMPTIEIIFSGQRNPAGWL